MPNFIRVTDEVKPRREYSIPETVFIEGVHTVVKGSPGAEPDGTAAAPKYTPESLAGSGQSATTKKES